MSQKIYISGGTYKTATEFISRNFLQKLNSDFYIFSAPLKNINTIYHIFLDIVYHKCSLQHGKENIHKILKQFENKKILIQSPGFFGHRYNGHYDYKKRFEILEEVFNKPYYIVTLREQSSSIYSQWHAGIKKRVKIPFNQYVSGDIQFVKNQEFLKWKEITNYKLFDYNEFLKPYLDMKLCNKERHRVLVLIYEELFSNKKNFFEKYQSFIGSNYDLENIDMNFINKSSDLEEVNLKCFLFFNIIHKIILKILYLFLLLFKFFGYKANLKPPFLNYKFENIFNPFSLYYLKFIKKYIFKFFFKEKNLEYDYNKKKMIKKIKQYYRDKNILLDQRYNLCLKNFKYFD